MQRRDSSGMIGEFRSPSETPLLGLLSGARIKLIAEARRSITLFLNDR